MDWASEIETVRLRVHSEKRGQLPVALLLYQNVFERCENEEKCVSRNSRSGFFDDAVK